MGAVTINVAIEMEGDEDACDKVADLVTGMPEFFQAVIAERAAQDKQWGGKLHDDRHGPFAWMDLLHSHVDRLLQIPPDNEAGWTSASPPEPDYRQRLIKIAALAVAAAQVWDRGIQERATDSSFRTLGED